MTKFAKQKKTIAEMRDKFKYFFQTNEKFFNKYELF